MKSSHLVASVSLALVLSTGLAASTFAYDQPAGQSVPGKSLWDRLGGEKAVGAVVDDFVGRAAANPKVNFTRKGVGDYKEWAASNENVAKLKKGLIAFISSASGGPLKYEGKDMKGAHKGMKITQAEFDALAGDLKASLDKFKVPDGEQKELLTAVAGTAKDIVEVKPPLWDRLGGEKAVTAVVDDFVNRAAGDAKVNFTRKGVGDYKEWAATNENVAKLKKSLVAFISSASGGPIKYEGKDMKSSHKGMKITQAEFDALAGDLKATLDKFKVPEAEQKDLLAAVAGTAKDIVEAK